MTTLSARVLSLYLKRTARGVPANRALERILQRSGWHTSIIPNELAVGVADEVRAGRAHSDILARVGAELPANLVYTLVAAVGKYAGTNGVLQVRDSVTDHVIQTSTREWLANTFDIEQLRVSAIDPNNEHLLQLLGAASRRRSPQPVVDDTEFRQRVRRKDTRIFAAWHDGLGDAPLAWVECALRDNIPMYVDEVLQQYNGREGKVCVFYSLATVEQTVGGLGVAAKLIRAAVRRCAEEDNAKRFVTMSPIPGYRKWAIGNDGVNETEAKEYKTVERYLNEGHCAVGRFHKRNGAVLANILLDADNSPRGMRQSMGAMAVYEYPQHKQL